MTDWFRCNSCKRLFALIHGPTKTCPSCGGSSGETVSGEHVGEGVEAGAYFNIDPRTGKRSKKKKPR
jgi:hypothetical protein